MATDTSIWSFIVHAGWVVKFVMIILLAASIASWTIIFQRYQTLRRFKKQFKQFEARFWSGIELNQLYDQINQSPAGRHGLAHIFHAGFSEFKKLHEQPGISPEAVMAGTQRAMRVAIAREQDELEKHLAFLATVGSTSPYVGLFGTVWGIMTSFQALGTVSQATIAMVAPGISEALIATAIGLFAAIPAVIAYNRFNNELTRLANQSDTFLEEFSTILHRLAHGQYSGAMQ